MHKIIRKWNKNQPRICPICGSSIKYKNNSGLKRVVFLKGAKWIVTNFYTCLDQGCANHHGFTMAPQLTIPGRKFALDVWSKVIRKYFKRKMSHRMIAADIEDEDHVKISYNAVRDMCNFFKVAGSKEADAETLVKVKENKKMILSLDATGDGDGGPSFWIFTDRLSNRVLHAAVLDHASTDDLGGIIKMIQRKFDVPISYVISDRQDTIVKAVKKYLSGVKHVYCQFHFLSNIAKPIKTKDNALLRILKREIKRMNLVRHARAPKQGEEITANSSVHELLKPLADELLNAVATTGDHIKVFPGLEAYANLEHIMKEIEPLLFNDLPHRVKTSMVAVHTGIHAILMSYKEQHDIVIGFVNDFTRLRKIFGHRNWSGKHVKKEVGKWVKMLKSRLQRCELESKPEKLKSHDCGVGAPEVEIWQEWVRLCFTHEDGLYIAYDIKKHAEFTNNPMEWLFRDGRSACRKRFGRGNTRNFLTVHGKYHCKVDQLVLTDYTIREILMAAERGSIKDGLADLQLINGMTRRTWRIREKDTGNIKLLEERLLLCLGK